MTKLAIIKPVVIVEGEGPAKLTRDDVHTVLLVEGEPAAVDGVRPVISVQIADPERDVATLLRAAEELLPIYREAPGIVIVGQGGAVEGIVTRSDLEEAVLDMQSGRYAALAHRLGLRAAYRPPAGFITAPFVYWKCPNCDQVRVPPEGHEGDPPPECRLHDPVAKMERHVHGGE